MTYHYSNKYLVQQDCLVGKEEGVRGENIKLI